MSFRYRFYIVSIFFHLIISHWGDCHVAQFIYIHSHIRSLHSPPAESLSLVFYRAFIHAALMTCNQENVLAFLQRCWTEEERRESESSDDGKFSSLTVLHICAFHAIRRIRSFVSRKTTDAQVRKLAVNAYRALLRTKSRSEAEKIVSLTATVFGRKKKSAEVTRAREELERIQGQHEARTKAVRAVNPSAAAESTATPREDEHDNPDDPSVRTYYFPVIYGLT